MNASDHRRAARTALSGSYWVAVLVNLIAAALGGAIISDSASFSFNFNTGFTSGSSAEGNAMSPEAAIALLSTFLVIFAIAMVLALVLSLVYMLAGSPVRLGHAAFLLKAQDGEGVHCSDIKLLFSYYRNYFWSSFLANFLSQLFVFLWSLLFIIPGIIAGLSYAMVPFILSENPDMAPMDALRLSKEMMRGNKWRLFCLNFSFIGWRLLCILTCGVGFAFLNPYIAQAHASFYRELSPRPIAPSPALDESSEI